MNFFKKLFGCKCDKDCCPKDVEKCDCEDKSCCEKEAYVASISEEVPVKEENTQI
jgi:hypothetical protein